MWRRIANAVFYVLIAGFVLLHPLAFGQQDAPQGGRKVLARVVPTYPALARMTNVSGTVKLDALIAPDGKVKSIEVIGGNPILVQAAMELVRKWKFEPAVQQTKERVELKFSPH